MSYKVNNDLEVVVTVDQVGKVRRVDDIKGYLMALVIFQLDVFMSQSQFLGEWVLCSCQEVGTIELPPHKVFINVDLPEPLSPIIMMEKLIDFFNVFLFLKAADDTFSVE